MISFSAIPGCLVLSLVIILSLLAVGSCHREDIGANSRKAVRELKQGSGEKPHDLEPADLFPDEDEVNYYTANIEDFFEGDIILTPDQRKQVIKDIEEQQREMEEGKEQREHDIHARAVVRDSSYLWPNAVIPYVISSNLPGTHVAAIRDAMQEYQDKTCVRFEPRSGQNSYVRFIRDRGCYSYVGRVGGVQEISIGDGCQYRGIVMHEMFHALGRWHEHSRPDRDSYITVNYGNIRNGFEGQFYRLRSTTANTNGIPYDYSSIMHYNAYAFSRNRAPTITPKKPQVRTESLGQRNGFSNLDFQHITNLYCSGASTPSQWSSWGNWGQCSVSCGSGMQSRTRSCQGSSCSGSNAQTRPCNSDGPNCAGRWSSWSLWGSCSPSCGTNRVRSRSRTCEGKGECVGESSQRDTCADSVCPGVQRPATGMSEWSPWGRCSALCGGYQIRRRSCLNSRFGCSIPYYQLRRCSFGNCSSWNRFDEGRQNPQQQETRQGTQQDGSDVTGMGPISAGCGVVPVVSLLLGCAMTTIATLMN